MEFDRSGRNTITVRTSHPEGIFVAFSPDENIHIGNRVRVHQASQEDIANLQKGDLEVLGEYFAPDDQHDYIYRIMKWGRLLLDQEPLTPLSKGQLFYEYQPNTLGHRYLKRTYS